MRDINVERGVEVNADVTLGCDGEKLLETLKRCKKITVIRQPDGMLRTKTTIVAEDCATGL